MAYTEEAALRGRSSEALQPDHETPHEMIPAEIADRLPEDFRDLFTKVGDKETVMRIISIAEEYSGAVPHPRTIAQFKETMPDAPDRIFKMAEKQQDHRMYLETRVIEGDIRRADLGLILGFIIFIAFGVGGMALLFVGRGIEGYIALATSILGGVGNFIRVGRERARAVREQTKNKKKKPPLHLDREKATKSAS